MMRMNKEKENFLPFYEEVIYCINKKTLGVNKFESKIDNINCQFIDAGNNIENWEHGKMKKIFIYSL